MIISAEQKEELLKRFFQGESASTLASEYKISRAIIYKWIKQNGGLVKMDRDTYNNLEREKQIEENNLLRSQLKTTYELLEFMSSQIEYFKKNTRCFYVKNLNL